MTSRPGPVRFGIRLIDDIGGPNALVDLGVEAERAGFDVLLFPHGLFRTSSWVLNAALAERTERIELSAGAPFRTSDPAEVAMYVATLDHISRGRVTIRVGAHNFETLRWIGIENAGDDVVPRVRETAALLRKALRGDRTSFDGAFFHWTENAYLRFETYRREIPISITAIGEPLLELSGEIGDGCHPMVTPPESADLIMAPIRRGLARSADPLRPFEASAYVWLAVSEDGDEARGLLADIVSYYGYHLDPRALATIGLTLADFKPVYDARMREGPEAARRLISPAMLRTGIAGTPEECARQLRVIVDAGFDNINIGGPIGRDPVRAMRLIAERVIPAFR